VNELTLGLHQLLVVSNVDAIDENGNWIEISTWRKSHENAMFAKTLRAWTQCSVHGVKRLVVGSRNDDGILEDIKIQYFLIRVNFIQTPNYVQFFKKITGK